MDRRVYQGLATERLSEPTLRWMQMPDEDRPRTLGTGPTLPERDVLAGARGRRPELRLV